MKRMYAFLASLNLGLWLLAGVMLFLAAGSFSSGGSEGSSINDLALFRWLEGASIRESWWLWVALPLLLLLALNTVLCSIEWLRARAGKKGLLNLLAPQFMHLGFLLILVAHLASARGGEKESLVLHEGRAVALPDGSGLRLTEIRQSIGSMGFPTDFSATATLLGKEQRSQEIRPNTPFFHGGYGYYLKEVAPPPYRAALVEVHREPGAGLALAGALLFSAGNLALLAARRGRE